MAYMAPIYIMAILTTVAGGGLYVGLGVLMARRYRWLTWLVLVGLPLSALINLLVKKPVLQGLARTIGPSYPAGPPLWYWLFVLLLAPVTEEAIKAMPVLFPRIRRWAHEAGTALWTGFFLGIGFGLGEIWFIAWSVASTPQYAGIPWWQFTGFLNERLLVTLVHGIMTAVFVTGIARGRGHGWLGYLYAVGLHSLTNVGALLYQMKLIPASLAGLWTLFPVIIMVLLFTRMYHRHWAAEPPAETILFKRTGSE